jgi:hypothetical protein
MLLRGHQRKLVGFVDGHKAHVSGLRNLRVWRSAVGRREVFLARYNGCAGYKAK